MTASHFYFIIIDFDGNYKYINPAFSERFSCASENLTGTSINSNIVADDIKKCDKAITECLSSPGKNTLAELRNQNEKGDVYWTRWEFAPYFNGSSKPAGIQCTGIDITEYKNSLQKENGSENMLQSLTASANSIADAAPVMIWMSDAKNKTVYVNAPWIAYTGMDANETAGKTRMSVIHPDDVEEVTSQFNKSFIAQAPVKLVYRLKNKTGEYRWVLDTAIPGKSAGTFLGYIGSIVDINEQKIKEDKFHYYAAVLDSVSDIVMSLDLDGTVKSWNKVAEKFYGISSTDAIGKTVNELFEFDYLNSTRSEALKHLFQNGSWKGEVAYTNNKGEKKYLLITISLVLNENQKEIGILKLGRDITQKKIAEQKMEESELFYRNLISNSLDGMVLTDEKGTIIFSSPSIKNLLLFDVEDVLNKNVFDFVHDEDKSWAAASFQNELLQTPEIKSITIRLLKKDGEYIWCMVRGHNLLSNPYVKGIVIYFHDETLRQEAKEALKESEQRFRSMVRNLQLGIMLQDKSGKILLCNQTALDLLEFKEHELLGKNISDIHWDVVKENGKPLPFNQRTREIVLKTMKPVRNVVMGVRRQKTGERVWLLVNAEPGFDEHNNVAEIITSFTDITERRRLAEQLVNEEINRQRLLTQATIDGQEKERKEIGKELHDNIGQQLTTIKLFLDMAKSTADATTLEMVNMASKSVSDVINDIREMSRSLVPPTLRDLGLVESVKELCESIRRSQAFNIRFYHNDFEEERLADNQNLMLYRIIQELINNVIKHSEAKNVILKLCLEEEQICLYISDDGKGFDPKKGKKGLGLLNIVNRVTLFNGTVDIQSSVKDKKGSKIQVTIPIMQTEPVTN